MNIPKVVRELRTKVGKSQANLAKMVGVSQSVIARMEKGTRVPDPLPTMLVLLLTQHDLIPKVSNNDLFRRRR